MTSISSHVLRGTCRLLSATPRSSSIRITALRPRPSYPISAFSKQLCTAPPPKPRPRRGYLSTFFWLAHKTTKGVCLAVGASGLVGLGLTAGPIASRSAITEEEKEEVWQVIHTLASDEPLQPISLSGGELPELHFEDLQRPQVFLVFFGALRVYFGMFADATGSMTCTELEFAIHKLVDMFIIRHLPDLFEPPAHDEKLKRAKQVRGLSHALAPLILRCLDADGDKNICMKEFLMAGILVVAALRGSNPTAVQQLAFRIMDEDHDGYISKRELTKWVSLAFEADCFPEADRTVSRWFGISTKVLSVDGVVKRYFQQYDTDRDGAITFAEFAALEPSLDVSGILRNWIGKVLSESTAATPADIDVVELRV